MKSLVNAERQATLAPQNRTALRFPTRTPRFEDPIFEVDESEEEDPNPRGFRRARFDSVKDRAKDRDVDRYEDIERARDRDINRFRDIHRHKDRGIYGFRDTSRDINRYGARDLDRPRDRDVNSL